MQKTRRLVLALGESTHTHMLHSEKETEYEIGDDEAIRFLLSGTGVVLHEDHDRMVLPANSQIYKTNQVEFNPFDRTVETVWD